MLVSIIGIAAAIGFWAALTHSEKYPDKQRAMALGITDETCWIVMADKQTIKICGQQHLEFVCKNLIKADAMMWQHWTPHRKISCANGMVVIHKGLR